MSIRVGIHTEFRRVWNDIHCIHRDVPIDGRRMCAQRMFAEFVHTYGKVVPITPFELDPITGAMLHRQITRMDSSVGGLDGSFID